MKLQYIELELTVIKNDKEFIFTVKHFARVTYQDICNFDVKHNCNLFLIPLIDTLNPNGNSDTSFIETEQSLFNITGDNNSQHYSCIYDNEISNVKFINRDYKY